MPEKLPRRSLLFVSNLFPDASESYRGLDNAVMCHHLREFFDLRVLAARPRLPWKGKLLCRPRAGDQVLNPSYFSVPYVPRWGSRWNDRLFARALGRTLKSWAQFPPVWLVAWAFPDGAAVSLLAKELGIRYGLIAQGTDVHTYLQDPVRASKILKAFDQAGFGATRSQDLSFRLEQAGLRKGHSKGLINGVDTDLFCPGDPVAARRKLGLPEKGKLVAFVGNFYPVKNPQLLVEAFRELIQIPGHADDQMVLIGGGHLEGSIRDLLKRFALGHRVHLVGRKQPEEVASILRAADVLCMTSRNEGVPNVILEAFATGIPVVATDVGGIHEVLHESWLGERISRQEPEAVAAGLHRVLASSGSRDPRISAYAEGFSWKRVAERYRDCLLPLYSGVGS